jgi:lambda family phage tail tape measure protein
LFGDEAGSKFLALLNSSEGQIKTMFAAVRDSGGVAEKTQKQMQGFDYAVKVLGGNFEYLTNQVGGAIGFALKPFIDVLNAAIGAAQNLPGPIKAIGSAAAAAGITTLGLVAAITALKAGLAALGGATAIKAAITGVLSFGGTATTATGAITGLKAAMLAIPGVGWAAAAIIGAGLLGKAAYDTNETFRNFVDNIGGVLASDFRSAVNGMAADARAAAGDIDKAYKNLATEMNPAADFIRQLFKDVFKDTSDSAQVSATQSTGAFNEFFTSLSTSATEGFAGLNTIISNWWDSLPAPIQNIFGGNAASILAGAATYTGGAIGRSTQSDADRLRAAGSTATYTVGGITYDTATGAPVKAPPAFVPGNAMNVRVGDTVGGGEKAGASLLQAIEQREEALLNLRTQREEQLAQIREQAVEQAKQIETQLADRRLAIERQIADITRQRSDFTEDSERRIRAASGESSDRIADEQRIADIFREERDSRIDSERRLADDKKQQEETIANFQKGVAKSINDANRAHTQRMGEIQKQYATSVAKIIDEGTGKAGKRLAAAAQLAALYIQRGVLNNQIGGATGLVIPERASGKYDFAKVGSAGVGSAQDIRNAPRFQDVKIPLDTLLKLDETIERLREGLSTLRAPGIGQQFTALSGTSFDVSKLGKTFGEVASASFIGGLLAQNSGAPRPYQVGDTIPGPPAARRTPESQILRDAQGRPLNLGIPSAAATAQLRNDQAQTEQEAARAKAAQQIKEAFAGVNAESAQFTNGLNEQLDLLGSQRKFLDMGFSDSLSRDLANLDKALATSKVRLQDIATDLKNRGSDPATVDALGKAAIARAQELYSINAKITQELEKQAQAMRTRQDDRIGLGMQEGVQSYLESIGTMRQATQELTVNGIKGVEDAIFSLATTGKANFKEFAASVLQDVSRMIIRQLILRSIMQIIGAIGGSPGLGSLASNIEQYAPLENANGNAFAQNGIQPFASGGIVNSPTLFKFASGSAMRTGVMGEAGPEAIIPLKRGRDGKLGVAGGGGSGGTSVTVNVDASGNSQVSGDPGQAAALGRVVSQAVQSELIRQKRPGGILATA